MLLWKSKNRIEFWLLFFFWNWKKVSNAKIIQFNPTALRKAKIVYDFGLSECGRVKKFSVRMQKIKSLPSLRC